MEVLRCRVSSPSNRKNTVSKGRGRSVRQKDATAERRVRNGRPLEKLNKLRRSRQTKPKPKHRLARDFEDVIEERCDR